MSQPDAEIISMEEQRQARADRGAAAARRDRPRCQAETGAGRRCRNYAVEDGYCRVHADEAEPGESADDPDGAARAEASVAGRHPAPDRTTAPGAGHSGPFRGRVDREELERVASAQGLSGAVDAMDALREAAGDRWLDHLREAADFAQRRLTGDYEIDDFGFDEDLTTNVLMPLLRPLHRHYWRVASHGAEHLPREGGGLVVANHAGTLPADAMITRLDILEQTDRHARELAADLVFRLPLVGELARKTGATLASNDDADRLLERGELVAVWPEGFKGVGKRWKDRYKLQRFGRGGFVATALRAQVPIIPTAIVGSEEIYPMVYDLRVVARALGLPYFPVVAQMFALPVLGPLALLPLPSKWIIEYGEPIDTTAYGPGAAEDPMAVFDLTDRVRETIQDMLHRNLLGRRSIFL